MNNPKSAVRLFSVLAMIVSCVFLMMCSKSTNSGSPVYPTDCAASLAGAYTGVDYCSGSGQLGYPCTVTATTPNNITISNLYGTTVTATVDYYHNTVTIPTQSSGYYSISGTGTYTANRIVINWTELSAGLPLNCSTTYTR